jgi:acetyl esterase
MLEAAVETRNDVIARSDAPGIPIRIYRPKYGSQGLGAFVFFHGGGFALGTLDSEHHRCAYLAREAECVVVSVDYRLAPEHKFPAGLDDCFHAVVWVAENARGLGVVPGRLAVGGASSGGALAAGVALRARDQAGPLLSFQLLIYPVLDPRMETASMAEFTDAPIWNADNNRVMWSYYLPVSGDGRPLQYASPAQADSYEGLPPAMIAAAELDCLRDEAIEYALALSRAGVPVELHTYPGAFHGFDLAAPHAEISQRTLGDQARALGRALRRQPRIE